jgi:Mg-chelatase subunit ChlD
VPVDIEELLSQKVGTERRTRMMVESRTGRARGATRLEPGERPHDLALPATLKQAVLRQVCAGGAVGVAGSAGAPPASSPSVSLGERPTVQPSPRHTPEASRPASGLITRSDLCRNRRYRPCDRLIVLLVDCSDSMGQGTVARMRACKGAALAVLRQAYQHRSRVALIGFGGEQARLILPPTRSISRAQRLLERLPAGGATPFGDGLFKAWQLVRRERLRNPGLVPVLIIVSDGEANTPMTEGRAAVPELYALAEAVAKDRLATALIDVVAEAKPGLEMRRLAALLGASYVKVIDLKPRHILHAVRQAGSSSR